MKKTIRLDEKKLNRIVKEAIEGVSKLSTIDELIQIENRLSDITTSGFIPFSSPAPSSTEMRIKKSILTALSCVRDAIEAMQN